MDLTLNIILVTFFVVGRAATNNKPYFVFPKIGDSTTIAEDAKVGSLVYICNATDPDDKKTSNGTLSYNFQLGNQERRFSMDASTCAIYVAQPLNWDITKLYQLNLQVTDGGGLSTTRLFNVNITDVNNNPPSCSQSLVWGTLFENATAYTEFAKLNCSDPDTGNGSLFDYTVYLGNNKSSSDTIGASRVNNSAYILRSVDYETEKHVFTALVIMTDKGSPQQTSNITVIYTNKDIDDNKPVFNPSGIYAASVDEGVDLGYIVLKLSATDIDAPNTPASTITFESNCTRDLLAVDRYSGVLFVKDEIDYEQTREILCTVSACSESLSKSYVDVKVTVIDKNDGIPTFPQPFYIEHIPENSPTDKVIASIVATDPENNNITYSAEPNGLFGVRSNGSVFLKFSPDYEAQSSYLVTIKAVDNGSPPLSSTTLLQVLITPVNEYSPEVVSPKQCTATVSEDAVPGTSVLTVNATDRDAGLDGVVSYIIQTAPSVPFYMDRTSGLLVTATNLDYETVSSYPVTIIISDNSTTTIKSTSLVCNITVLDVNDESVDCLAPDLHVIKYPFTIGAIQTSLKCSVGSKPVALNYTIMSGDDGTFQFDQSTGELILNNKPKLQRYNLGITVSYGAMSTYVTLIVLAELELNFTNLPSNITIKEREPGRLLIHIEACCAFSPLDFVILSGNTDNRVTLTGSNGQLTLMVPYDREYQATYVYDIQVRSKSGQAITSTFTVYVEDVNDNAPEFASGIAQITIDATLQPGSLVEIVTATDKDTNDTAKLTYILAYGNIDKTFSLNATGYLFLDNSLDVDKISKFTLEIVASDNGVPSLNGTFMLEVIVIDNRNITPQLVPSGGSFNASLSEDSALGMTVFQLQPASSSSRYVYQIVSGNSLDSFQIDPNNGSIIIVKRLDRETISNFALNISATNEKGLSTFVLLSITILDVNDNSPAFSVGVFSFCIPDQSKVGTIVGSLNVSDPDDGPNGTIDIKIDQGNSGPFNISGFDIVTNAVVNYNVQKNYGLSVTANDRGTPSRSSTALVLVCILNGNIPHFNTNSDKITLPEDTSLGSLIYDANATDKGAIENGSITYSITSVNNNFNIKPMTGQIVLMSALDYETVPQIVLTIEAKNKDQPSLSPATLSLTIQVLNVNEHCPYFPQKSYTFDVNEDEKPNYVVATMTAIDLDKDNVFYTWSGFSAFEIDHTSGIITLNSALDYLTAQYYTYILNATDSGQPTLSTIVAIVINIIDINNHKPELIGNTTFEVLDSVPIGSEIFKVNYKDLDTGNAGIASFQIQNPLNPFTINTSTGVIQTKERLNALITSSYVVTILIFDHGTPSLNSTGNIKVIVISTNPNYYDPEFAPSCPSSAVTVPRKSQPGFIVSSCQATDKDVGISGQVEHFILSGNEDGYFLIDYTSGAITTTTNLLLAKNNYALVLLAVDLGVFQRNATKQVQITIVPSISSSNIKVDYNFSILENTSVSSLVGTIDLAGSRTVSSYKISAGNYGNAFDVRLNGNNGELIVRNSLDSETYSLFALIVDVTTDAGDFAVSVQVNVIDVNDNPPTFTNNSSTLVLAIPECSPNGMLVGTVTYTDLDIDAANRDNSISIQPSPGSLTINSLLELRLAVVLDFETQQTYSASVTVRENIWPFGTSTLSITINVIDVLEEEHVSTSDVTESALISLEVPKQAAIGHLVYTLKPGDFALITKQGDTIKYIVYKSIGPFSINEDNGDIKVTQKLSLHTTYILWAMIKVFNGSSTVSRTCLIRVDTFDITKEMVVIEYNDAFTYVKNNLLRFRARAQTFFSETQRIGFSNVLDTSTVSRRRLLAQKSSAATYTYVVSNTAADNMSNINEPKTFMTDQQILNVLQASRDGSPVLGLSDTSVLDVATVEPFQETETSTSFEDFIKSPAGIAVFCLLALLLLVLLILIVTCIFYRKWRKNGGKTKKDSKKDSTKRKSFSRMANHSSFLNGNPQIIVSAPPPVTLHNLTVEKPVTTEDLADNVFKQDHVPNGDIKDRDNTVTNATKGQNAVTTTNIIKDPNIKNGLPSQFALKGNDRNLLSRNSAQ